MRICNLVLSAACLAASVPSCYPQAVNGVELPSNGPYRADANLFQVSTLGALEAAVLEGAYPIGLLKHEGNFGVGHYVGLGGELIALDGHFYHAYSDGTVDEAQDKELVPFAAVLNFTPEQSLKMRGMTMAQLDTFIANKIPSDNYFYAIKIHGLFSYVKTRIIPQQVQPYPTLDEAITREVIFIRQNEEGTAVVIRSPQYVANLNIAGDHYHFISDDHQYGGHALDLTVQNATLEIQQIRRNTLWLPATTAFQKAPLPAPAK